MKKTYDIVVVGAGLSGAVLAERFASQNNLKVLVVEKRNHIGGNCYDFIDENGILVNKYGAHLFHTNYVDVWNYIRSFCNWKRWDHRVLGLLEGKLINLPININTVNSVFELNIENENEMKEWLSYNQVKFDSIENSRDMALSRIGLDLYQKIVQNYTFKQWGKSPDELDPSVLARIPVRNNFDDRYFTDKYQALPENGYTYFVKQLLNHFNIEIVLNSKFQDIRRDCSFGSIFYTGPIDDFYSETGLEKLEYRSINFVTEHYRNMNFYQQNSVINHLDSDTVYNRSVEYKHFLNQVSPHTTIIKEIFTSEGEPYYPVFDNRNFTLLAKYNELAKSEKNVYFVGRLANFKYFNMDQAIKNSLDFYSVFKGS